MKKKVLSLGCLGLAGVLAFTGCNTVQRITEEIATENGYVKASDYNIVVEEDTHTGASNNANYENEATQLTQAQIKQLILDQLRGFVLYWYKDNGGTREYVYPQYEEGVYPHTQNKQQLETMSAKVANGEYNVVYSYREMYQIATSHNNVPSISSVEMVLDTGTMKLYATSEKGTQKVLDIETNPNVGLYWVNQVDEKDYFADSSDSRDYWRSYGVQIVGTGKILNPEDDLEFYNRIANMYMQTMRGARVWDNMPAASRNNILNMLKTMNTWYEITPTRINSHHQWNLAYNKDNVCSTAELVEGSLVTTTQVCPTFQEGDPTEERLRDLFEEDAQYQGWHVNQTATLVNGEIVWTQTPTVGSLYKWTDGLQKKWAKALFGKSYRQVLREFTVTPSYPEAVTDVTA